MVKLLLALLLLLPPLTLQAVDREFDCLVRNVYQESNGEAKQGKLAVALVTLNRVEHPQYPKSICGVVYQKNQFSWTKHYSKVTINSKQWQEAKDAAISAYMDRGILGNFAATHFHNHTVKPSWANKMTVVAKYGSHTFYKFK